MSSSYDGQCGGCHAGPPHHVVTAAALWTPVHSTLEELLVLIKQLGGVSPPCTRRREEKGSGPSGGNKGDFVPSDGGRNREVLGGVLAPLVEVVGGEYMPPTPHVQKRERRLPGDTA